MVMTDAEPDLRADFVAEPDVLLRTGTDGVRFVDASWFLDQGRDPRAEHALARLPGAVFFDLDAVSDQASPLPHMLPSPAVFAAAAGALGLGAGDDIVVYDTQGLFSAPRVWWTFRTMGARHVRVLNGGLPAWRAAGGATETSTAKPAPARFEAAFDPHAVIGMDALARDLGAVRLLDARPAARFRGVAPEPREGLAAGHAPGAVSLPASDLTEGGRLLATPELRARLSAAGALDGDPVVTTCGSGVTAAILTLALATLGVPSRLYDGSWAEWGAAGGGPVATGD